MPGPYLHQFEVAAIVAREERRLASERAAWQEVLRWGMEEAGWRAALAAEAALPDTQITLGDVRARLADRGAPETAVAHARLPSPTVTDSAP